MDTRSHGLALISLGITLLAACSNPGGPQYDGIAAARMPATPTHPVGTIAAVTPLGGEPYGLAISSKGDLLVAQVLADNVTRFALPGTTPTTTIVTGAGTGPVHVAINPHATTAYVVEQFGNAVAVVNLRSNTVAASIALTNSGFNIIVSPDGRRIYASTADGRLYVINATRRAIVDSMVVGSAANGFAFSPDGVTLYASSRDAGTVTAFDTRTDAALATYTVGGRPQRLAVSPDGARLYAANEDSGLSVVDVTTGQILPSFNPMGSGYGLGETPDGAQLYLTEPLSGRMAIIDRAALQTQQILTLGGQPRNVAFTTDGTTGVVTDGAGNVIFIQ